MTTMLERRYRFSASHLYRRPEWNEARNRETFGACANLPSHGHNYRLWVFVGGVVDPETGFVVDLAALDAAVRSAVLERLDHRFLNEAIPEFHAGGRIPSSENLVAWIAQRLDGALPAGCRLEGIRLHEDEDLGASWWRDGGSR